MPALKPALISLLIKSVGRLPLGATRKLGSAMGSLTYALNVRSTKVTRTNLGLCLPHITGAAREKLVKESLQETGKVAAETCLIFSKSRPPIAELIRSVEGEDLARQALLKGRGLLILAPHLGNWEVLGQHLTSLAEVTNLYQPPKLEGLDDLIREGRERSGAKLVPTNAKGVAALLKTLKNNGISGILPDQNPNEEASGIYAPFFGHAALTMVLVNKLINRTGCTALLAFAKRVDGGFHLIYREPPAAIYDADQATAIAAMNEGVEALIMEAPAQYQWEYKRFKKVAAGQRGYYHNC